MQFCLQATHEKQPMKNVQLFDLGVSWFLFLFSKNPIEKSNRFCLLRLLKKELNDFAWNQFHPTNSAAGVCH